MRGRKTLDTELKKARGSMQPCRMLDNVIELPVVSRVPEPPKWINSEGKKLWREITPTLHARKILSEVDIPALAHLCQLHGEIVKGYRKKIPPTAAQLAQLRAYFSEFHLTPVSRLRGGFSGKDGKENRFRKQTQPPKSDA